MEIGNEIIQKTREHFGGLCKSLIQDVKNGRLIVNDPVKYIKWQETSYNKTMNGEYDHTFTHMQYAVFLETGETLPLLP